MKPAQATLPRPAVGASPRVLGHSPWLSKFLAGQGPVALKTRDNVSHKSGRVAGHRSQLDWCAVFLLSVLHHVWIGQGWEPLVLG